MAAVNDITSSIAAGRGVRFTSALLRSVLDFNYRILDYARPERLKELAPVSLDWNRLRGNAAAARRASRWVIVQWELQEPYAFDFRLKMNRVALLSPGTLERLSEHIGLILYSERIRRTILRAERQHLMEVLGEQRRHYAITRASIFGHAVDSSLLGDLHRREIVSLEEIRNVGWNWTLRCVDSTVPALVKRLELKLPAGVQIPMPHHEDSLMDTTDTDCIAYWTLVDRVLRMEFREEWNACFC